LIDRELEIEKMEANNIFKLYGKKVNTSRLSQKKKSGP
jgi:hypothetical protein